MPMVVPKPEQPDLTGGNGNVAMFDRTRLGWWPLTMALYMSSITMTTTLLTTGVHMGAAKLPRAFRMAPASELIP